LTPVDRILCHVVVALLVVELTACACSGVDGDRLPVWDSRASLICEAEECPDPRAVAAALVIVDEAFADVFGERSDRLRRVEIVWHDPGTCPIGCTGVVDRYSPSRVHVFAGARVSGSALAHELEHIVADDMWDDDDPEHVLAGLWRSPDLPRAYSIEEDTHVRIIEADL
jgi:hypothetical protein